MVSDVIWLSAHASRVTMLKEFGQLEVLMFLRAL